MTEYRMPAEWAAHEATWLTWPRNKTTWPGKMLAEVEGIYRQMIEALLPHEKVNLLVPDRKTVAKVLKTIRTHHSPNLIFHEVKAVDTWIRDYGPIFVKRTTDDGRRTTDKSAFVKFTFNAWGGKYKDLARDNDVVDRLPALKKFKRINAPLVLEGGSIEVNGEGICLTTEQCLLNPSRNPDLSRSDIEKYLRDYLGVAKIIWLKEGIEGDDTDGHVDDITRFCSPNTIVTATESNKRDKNHEILKENLHILRSERNLKGRRFRLLELPMPGTVGLGRKDTAANRLPASYANFYIANKVVLVPLYDHRNDMPAIKILQEAFSTRRIIGIQCCALVYGLGSIHCVTQQQPA